MKYIYYSKNISYFPKEKFYNYTPKTLFQNCFLFYSWYAKRVKGSAGGNEKNSYSLIEVLP